MEADSGQNNDALGGEVAVKLRDGCECQFTKTAMITSACKMCCSMKIG